VVVAADVGVIVASGLTVVVLLAALLPYNPLHYIVYSYCFLLLQSTTAKTVLLPEPIPPDNRIINTCCARHGPYNLTDLAESYKCGLH
jgi:hypothetical protein